MNRRHGRRPSPIKARAHKRAVLDSVLGSDVSPYISDRVHTSRILYCYTYCCAIIIVARWFKGHMLGGGLAVDHSS